MQEKTELSSQVEEELMEPGATDPSVPLDPSEQQQEIPPGRIAGGMTGLCSCLCIRWCQGSGYKANI